MSCCCQATCIGCLTQGCPVGASRSAAAVYAILELRGTSISASHDVTSIIPGFCKDENNCPSTSGTTSYDTKTFTRLIASKSAPAECGQKFNVGGFGIPLSNYVWLSGIDFYAHCGILISGAACSAFLEIGSNMSSGFGSVATNYNGNFRCAGVLAVSRSVSYSENSIKSRVEKSVTCSSDLVGMSVSWSALGDSSGTSAITNKSPLACPDQSTLSLSGGVLTLEVTQVDALP